MNILSIDGGGIRGILPLRYLVQHQLDRSNFDLIAGTSTGAIIAGGLAVGIPASEILSRYQRMAREVFRFDAWGFIKSLGSYRYSNRPLRDLLHDAYGDVMMGDIETRLIIPVTRVRDGKPIYITNDNNVSLVDAVTASACAPTYFEPYNIPRFGLCVDGGVGIAGNPVYVAATYAVDRLEADINILSLGTGWTIEDFHPSNFVQWVAWTTDQLLGTPSDQQLELVKRHYNAKLARINPRLDRDVGMDDVSAIPYLMEKQL